MIQCTGVEDWSLPIVACPEVLTLVLSELGSSPELLVLVLGIHLEEATTMSKIL